MNVFDFFIQLQGQLRILHWQTTSFARHKAYDQILGELNDLADTFVETYQGKFGRQKTSGNITLRNISDSELNSFIANTIAFLADPANLGLTDQDTDLLNMRDEVVGLLNQLRYLLTLE